MWYHMALTDNKLTYKGEAVWLLIINAKSNIAVVLAMSVKLYMYKMFNCPLSGYECEVVSKHGWHGLFPW